MKFRAHPDPNRAFTLIELITLAAIGVVLSAVLLPAVSNARARSGVVACADNQKQLALAMTLYATENSDALAPTDNWVNAAGVVVQLNGGGYWAGITPLVSVGTSIPEAMQRFRAGLTNGPLWAYTAHEEIHHCPSDVRFRLRPGSGWAYDSYSKVNGMAGLRGWEVSQLPFQRMSDIPEPSMSFLFIEESDPRGQNLGTWVLSTTSPGWVDPLAIRHDAGANSVYADGHTDYRRWTDARTIEAARNGDRGVSQFNWPGGNASNPDFRWVWERYRYQRWKPLQP